MSDDLQQLKDRLVKLSDDELIAMVLAPSGEYRQEAVDIAKNELKWRKVEISARTSRRRASMSVRMIP